MRGPQYPATYNWSWMELIARRKPAVTVAAAGAALEAAVREFALEARSLPLAQWPLRFWARLLEQAPMRATLPPGQDLGLLPPGPRAALLLRLVASLDVAPAAQALGVSAAAYEAALRSALANPHMDDARMQALRQRLHQQIHAAPAEQREGLARLRAQALASMAEPLPAEPARRRTWLWGVLAVLTLALLATFVGPHRPPSVAGRGQVLPPEIIAPAPALSDTVIVTHPDYQLLAEPADDALAQELPLLSWMAAAMTDPVAAEPAPKAAAATESLAELTAEQQALLSSASALWPALNAATRVDLLAQAEDWQARTPEERTQLRQRLQQWDRQSPTERALRRTPFFAWQRLSASDQQRVRAAAAKLAALPATEQQALRSQFAASPADTQRLWWMGPALGQELAPIAVLFAYLPEAERPALLEALRTLDKQSQDDLALLVPRLSEARRQALRKALLAAPPAQRPALVRQWLAE